MSTCRDCEWFNGKGKWCKPESKGSSACDLIAKCRDFKEKTMKFKKGDRVKHVELGMGTVLEICRGGDIGVRFDEAHSDLHELGGLCEYKHGWYCNPRDLKLIKEPKMKDTITLKELIEQDACKEGVLWFMDVFNSLNCLNCYLAVWDKPITVISVVKKLKQQGKDSYIDWLKAHGYNVEDKDDIKKQIKDLESEFKEKIKELKNKL
jgi:hypothetical protein